MRKTSPFAVAVVVILMGSFSSGCSESPGGECPAGSELVDDQCRVSCASDDDCESTQRCSSSGFCRAAVVSEKGWEEPVKLDMLWVLETGYGFCPGRLELADSFPRLLKHLREYVPLDLHLGVVSAAGGSQLGMLLNNPIDSHAPSCRLQKNAACSTDQDCEDQFVAGWACDGNGESPFRANGSIISGCFFTCQDDAMCCEALCSGTDCPRDERTPGQGCGYSCVEGGYCLPDPLGTFCDSDGSMFLSTSQQNLDHFRCLIDADPPEKFSMRAKFPESFKAAWQALRVDTPYPDQREQFLRPEAWLLLAFASNKDDCSVAEEFCSPSISCEDDADCWNKDCQDDPGFSEVSDQSRRTCCGEIRGDYLSYCGLLGTFQGAEHHQCAYDEMCNECAKDSDCPVHFRCGQTHAGSRKCLLKYFDANTVLSTDQEPPGTPRFSLAAVSEYEERFRTLKSDSAHVLVATIAGMPQPNGKLTHPLISDTCIEDASLPSCQALTEFLDGDTAPCQAAPSSSECLAFIDLQRQCIGECYLMAFGLTFSGESNYLPSVCKSDMVYPKWGRRLHLLAEAFADNGTQLTSCFQEGADAEMLQLAEFIKDRVSVQCLPEPPDTAASVKIQIRFKGDTEWNDIPIGEASGEASILYPDPACCAPDSSGECSGTSASVRYHDIPLTGNATRVTYCPSS